MIIKPNNLDMPIPRDVFIAGFRDIEDTIHYTYYGQHLPIEIIDKNNVWLGLLNYKIIPRI